MEQHKYKYSHKSIYNNSSHVYYKNDRLILFVSLNRSNLASEWALKERNFSFVLDLNDMQMVFKLQSEMYAGKLYGLRSHLQDRLPKQQY